MKMHFLLPALALFSSCFALDLDSMMTPKEKKETGYSSLSKQEKKELNQWLTKNLIAVQKTPTQSSLSLDVNIQSGSQLILSDGSRWEVDPQDRPVSSLWLTPVPLILAGSDSAEYPKILINVDAQQQKVKVRPAP